MLHAARLNDESSFHFIKFTFFFFFKVSNLGIDFFGGSGFFNFSIWPGNPGVQFVIPPSLPSSVFHPICHRHAARGQKNILPISKLLVGDCWVILARNQVQIRKGVSADLNLCLTVRNLAQMYILSVALDRF